MGLTSIRSGRHHHPGCVLVAYESAVPEFAELTMDSTGGCLDVFFSETSGEFWELSLFRNLFENIPENNPSQMDLKNMLEIIGQVLGLNKSQMAEVCGLRTRKALYDWESGAVPRMKSMQRVYLLYRAALDWSRSGFVHPEKVLHVPIVQGKNLYDLLKADTLDLEAVHFAGARLCMANSAGKDTLGTDPFAK